MTRWSWSCCAGASRVREYRLSDRGATRSNAAFKFEWLGKVLEGMGDEVDVFWAWRWRAVGSTWLEVFSQSPAGDSGWFLV
jgi:hypothetical protein